VVAGDEYEHRDDGQQAAERAEFQHARTERPAAPGLDGQEDQMAAIQYRDRQQIDDANVDRQQRHQQNQAAEAAFDEGLAAHLGNPKRAAETIDRAVARDHLANAIDAAGDEAAGNLGTLHDGRGGTDGDVLRAGGGDAKVGGGRDRAQVERDQNVRGAAAH